MSGEEVVPGPQEPQDGRRSIGARAQPVQQAVTTLHQVVRFPGHGRLNIEYCSLRLVLHCSLNEKDSVYFFSVIYVRGQKGFLKRYKDFFNGIFIDN